MLKYTTIITKVHMNCQDSTVILDIMNAKVTCKTTCVFRYRMMHEDT